MRKLLFAGVLVTPLAVFGSGACGGSSSSPTSAEDASVDAASLLDHSRIDGPVTVPGPCEISVDAPAFLPAVHVAIGTHVEYDSNPPSSGPHYPVWAAFQTWPTVLQREYYVHDMEHGAVVLLYKCDHAAGGAAGGCADTVAAAAWGWTYKAKCLDVPSLTDFAKAHYGQGTEPICANGATTL